MNLTTEFSERLVTLCDGRPGLRGGIHVDTREPAAAGSESHALPAVLDFVSSDETLDRYDEIISASGWQLVNYQRNPVFQNAHQYGDIIFTLGKAVVTEVREGRLFQRIEFATDANPMARIAYGLYKGKFLNAVSVGFIPLRWENGSAEKGFRRKYLEQELLEVSAVGIPANPNALALGLKAGAVEKADLKELRELLSRTLSGECQVSRVEKEARICLLARQIRDLLKRI
jgi:HK97 family phage prohead protease